MNVVSLFNGMGTLRQAMHDLNIKVDKYYSSEIKPYAIELQQHHFPDVIQVGDINNWKEWDIDWKTIDFIGSGSPCQDLSICGKQKGVEKGNRSSLFFVFVEILNHIRTLNPNIIFFQENVGSAPKLDVGIMSRALGVYPVRINSSLVTAQLRDRYYWTNIRTYETMFDIVTDIPQPRDKDIKLQDILITGKAENEKATCILESQGGAFNIAKNQKSFIKRIGKRFIEGIIEDDKYRVLTKVELCRLQGFPDNYCDILSYQKAGSLLGDGWTLPIVIHFLSFLGKEKIKQKDLTDTAD